MSNNRIHAIVVFALALTLIYSIGCSSSNSNSTGPSDTYVLTGTWKLTSVILGLQTFTPEEAELQLTVTFRDDGTFTSVQTDEGVTGTYSGTWRVEGNTLIIVQSGNTETAPYTLSENTLRVTRTEENVTYTLVLTRQ